MAKEEDPPSSTMSVVEYERPVRFIRIEKYFRSKRNEIETKSGRRTCNCPILFEEEERTNTIRKRRESVFVQVVSIDYILFVVNTFGKYFSVI